ncbi:MAG: hypothetical protein ABIX01_17440 [Chitinophagaceae bacterium]
MKYTIAFVALLTLPACRSNEIGFSKDVNPETIYQEYNVSATEGDRDASFTAQFRFGGSNGTTLVLDADSPVTLDGKKLAVDSNAAMGAFYQTHLPISGATGAHSWKFANGKGKTYINNQHLNPFSLVTDLRNGIAPADLELQFNGLADGEKVNITISDTSRLAQYHDLDTSITVVSGKGLIPAAAVKRLAAGPLSIYIGQYKNTSLDEATKEGGVLNYRFDLRAISTLLKK